MTEGSAIKANKSMGWDDLRNCLEADPEGYESNLFVGLFLSRDRVNMLSAEPYLLKALAFGLHDEHTVNLLERLSWISGIKGNHGQAAALLTMAVQISPNNPHLALQKGHALFQIGASNEAFAIFKQCIESLYESAEVASRKRGVPITHLLEPHPLICKYIGELAAKLDLYLKARALGLVKGERAILCAPDKFMSNRAFAEYWTDHVEIIFGDAAEEAFREYRDFFVHLDYFAVPGKPMMQRDLCHRSIQKMWEDKA